MDGELQFGPAKKSAQRLSQGKYLIFAAECSWLKESIEERRETFPTRAIPAIVFPFRGVATLLLMRAQIRKSVELMTSWSIDMACLGCK